MRIVPLAEFFDGYRKTVVGRDEIVTALLVPAEAGRGRFVKLGARRYLVISIVMAAGYLETGADGRIAVARVAVGACSATAQRLTSLESDLVGLPLREAAGLAVGWWGWGAASDQPAEPLPPLRLRAIDGKSKELGHLDCLRTLLPAQVLAAT